MPEITIIDIVGFFAMITATISLIPQVLQMWQTRSVADVSMGMIINFIVSCAIWIIFGILTDSWTVWLTNIIMLIFALQMLYLKIRYRE